MAPSDDGNDSVRRTGTGTTPTAAKPKAARANDGPREVGPRQRTAPSAATTANDEASNVRRIRAQESAPDLDHELGYRDTTVVTEGTPPGDVPRSHRRKSDAQRAPEIESPLGQFDPNVASLLLGLSEGMFAAAWGDEARFTPKERQMIEPPLGRILARMSPDDATKFAAFADPVFLASGLLIWGVRVWTIQQRKAHAARPATVPDGFIGPVIQGMPADRVTTRVHQDVPGDVPNGKVDPGIVENWGNI